jgi:hypothetical protein
MDDNPPSVREGGFFITWEGKMLESEPENFMKREYMTGL